MSIIKKIILNNNIGIDIGDGIMNNILEKNTIIPCKNIEKFIIEDENIKNIKIYYGNNIFSKNNFINTNFKIKPNKLHLLTINIINEFLLIIKLFNKNNLNYQKQILKLNNYYVDNLNYLIDKNIINKYKIIYIFKITKNKLIKSLKLNDLLPENIKNKIIDNVVLFYDNIENYETQKIMEKINIIKLKFVNI